MNENMYFGRKKIPICDFFRSDQMPLTGQIKEILLTCAPVPELPFNISTMIQTNAVINDSLVKEDGW